MDGAMITCELLLYLMYTKVRFYSISLSHDSVTCDFDEDLFNDV